MYRVYCGEKLLHDSQMENLRVYNVKADLEIGKTGAFGFCIYPNHPYYNSIALMQPGIELQRNGEIIFNGRALKIEYGFYNEKTVTCEGAMAYLLDSIITPDYYFGNFYGYFERLITVHNDQVEEAKQFKMGTVHVADFEGFEVSTSDYTRIFDAINTHIVGTAGGYLQVRYEGGSKYLDILSTEQDASPKAAQSIRLGENLIDVQREADGGEVFSSIIPLGDEVNGMRTNIGSVNDWIYYITDADAVARYGLIHKVITFDGITDPQTLKEAAEQYFADYYAEITNIEIAVVDTSASFLPGQWVDVYSKEHFAINPTALLVKKMHIAISNPEQTTITAGRMRRGIAESIAESTTAAPTATVAPQIEDGDLPKSPSSLWEEQDLNELLEPGYYVIPDTTTSSTILNKPPMTSTETALVEVIPMGGGLQKLQRYSMCDKDDMYIWQRLYYSGTWGTWMMIAGCSGWKNLTLDAAFVAYSTATQPKYRINGNLVTVMGAVSPVTAYNTEVGKIPFASGIPAAFRPNTPYSFVCQGSGLNKWACGVETNGTLTINRYGTTENANVPTTAWLIFNCTYSI